MQCIEASRMLLIYQGDQKMMMLMAYIDYGNDYMRMILSMAVAGIPCL